jgi:DTW domain-containing protein YfiP
MSYLSLQSSELFVGQHFANHSELNSILQNPEFNCLILYPGVKAVNLTESPPEVKDGLFVTGKKTVIIVIDGTWATAKKMMNRSPNLKTLKKICFTPSTPSRFRVRKQPRAECYSTIEAIHHTIELLGPNAGFDLSSLKHNSLLHVFDKMVGRQLEFMRDAFENPNTTSYRKVKRRVA